MTLDQCREWIRLHHSDEDDDAARALRALLDAQAARLVERLVRKAMWTRERAEAFVAEDG